MADSKKPSLFTKLTKVLDTALDSYIVKAKSDIAMEEEDAFYRKSVSRDPSYSIGSQGYHEKTSGLSTGYLKEMSRKNTIVAAIIQTIQNKVAAYATPSKNQKKKGFRIVLKNEELYLADLEKELFEDGVTDTKDSVEQRSEKNEAAIDASSKSDATADADQNQDGEINEREKRRILKKEMEQRTKARRYAIQEFILNCGEMKDRPFDSQRWNLDSLLRALVRDSYTYDFLAVEKVPDKKQDLHHFVPVDGSTIKFASPQLSKYKDVNLDQAADFLYPERELEALQNSDALTLDEAKLKNEEYRYAQVIRGKIARAFTADELSVGMRNPTTDLYANGYSISELELLFRIVSSHIFTENYNISYFTQGFSAKGILHIKAPINRRKLEAIRAQWKHSISGNRNSFQTPIMAGMDEVQWIPLTQSHSDMEFSTWMNYLIKIICAIYQIDPSEIGFGMKDEGGGGGGGGLSGDNTKEKLDNSKDKGLAPLLKFLANFLSISIIDEIDPDYKMEFVGVGDEANEDSLEQQEKEVTLYKTLNEVREEQGLPLISGADDLILNNVYLQWFTAFHPDGQQKQQNDMVQQQDQMMQQAAMQPDPAAPGEDQPEEQSPEDAAELEEQAKQADHDRGLEMVTHKLKEEAKYKKPPKPIKKSLRVEYFTLRK